MSDAYEQTGQVAEGGPCPRHAHHTLSLLDRTDAGAELYECTAPGCGAVVLQLPDGQAIAPVAWPLLLLDPHRRAS